MPPTAAPSVLRVDHHGAVRLLTFDRPEALNAFDFALYASTAAALDQARADDAVRAVVLTGSGRAFSAGQDLKEMAALADRMGPSTGAEAPFDSAGPDGPPADGQPADGQPADGEPADAPPASGFPLLLDALQAFDKPLLAAVNGVAIGIGATLLPHCDLVLVAAGARLRLPFAPLGVPPEAASSYLLPLRMGWPRAAEVLFTGDWITAEQAVVGGLALRVVPDDDVLAATLELAGRVAEAPLAALRAIKTTMVEAHREAVTAARAREDAAFAELLAGFNRDLLP